MTLQKLLPLALSASLGWSSANLAFAGEIKGSLEEPATGLFVSGLGKVQGWAFSSVALDRIEFYLNGTYLFDIPGGASRGDVAGVFPDSPNAENSGFAAVLNYNILAPGNHTIGVKAVDVDGSSWEDEAQISVDYFSDDGLVSGVSLDDATVTGSGNTINIENLLVEGESFDVALNWQTAIQGFGFASLAAADDGGGGGPTGECVTIPFPSAGSRIVWNVTGKSGGQNVTGTVDTTYTSVSDTGATSQTDSSLSAGGTSTTSDTTTVQTYTLQIETASGKDIPLLYASRIKVDGSASALGFNTTVNSTITFAPAKLFGPAKKFCEGYTWQAPSVEQTLSDSSIPGGPIKTNTPVDNGSVISISESVTVPAGTFNTVHRKVSRADGTVTDAWFDRVTGHLVKQVSAGNGGDSTVEEAKSIN